MTIHLVGGVGGGAVARGFEHIEAQRIRKDRFREELRRSRRVRLNPVNGHTLSPTAGNWVRYITEWVIPRLPGTRNAKLDLAARVTWWSLKEGVLDVAGTIRDSDGLDYPINALNWSLGSRTLGPSEVGGSIWQVGIAAAQVNASVRSERALSRLATRSYSGASVSKILGMVAETSGIRPETRAYRNIIRSTGALRVSWLMRIPVVAFLMEDKAVLEDCFSGGVPTCVGTGWPSSTLYAPNSAGAQQSISDLRDFFAKSAPRLRPP